MAEEKGAGAYQDVLDIIFADRNKAYGAYQLRRNYPKTVGRALITEYSGCSTRPGAQGKTYRCHSRTWPAAGYRPEQSAAATAAAAANSAAADTYDHEIRTAGY